MADLAAAVAEGAPAARVRALLEGELRHGAGELGAKRSGYERPVVVAIAPAGDGLRAVAPVAPELRADPDAAGERAWLLTAALVGALVETGGNAELRAGALAGHLVLEVPAAQDAELAALAFEEQVAPVDRLRAEAVVLGAGALDDAADLRPPIGAAHPLTVAARIAALGGRPADPASVADHEEAALAALEARDAKAARPHDDPDPARRVARRILQRLDGMGKWGGFHTEFQHLARGFAPADRALAADVGEALLAAGLLSEKPSVGQRHVFLNPRRAGAIRGLIDEGTMPDDLALPHPKSG
ncbi:MAG: hypothetical protein ACXVFL_17820 [Solirubrobacteraceae bacterium]